LNGLDAQSCHDRIKAGGNGNEKRGEKLADTRSPRMN
jgi:hypothetical protein